MLRIVLEEMKPIIQVVILILKLLRMFQIQILTHFLDEWLITVILRQVQINLISPFLVVNLEEWYIDDLRYSLNQKDFGTTLTTIEGFNDSTQYIAVTTNGEIYIVEIVNTTSLDT